MSQIAWFWSCQFLLCILPSKIINNLSKTRNRKSNQAFLPQEQERVYVFGGLHAGCWKGKKPVYRGRALWKGFFLLPSPVAGETTSPSAGSGWLTAPSPHRTHCASSYSTGTKEIQTSAVRHEIPKISFTGISRTWLVAAGCKQSPEAVGKPWARLLFDVSGKEKATLPLVMGSQALQSCGVTHSIGVT